jgi:hypothetical protein
MKADSEQNRSYFDAVRTLRDSVRLAPERAADLERMLDKAFATHQVHTRGMKRVESGWWRWIAAAAALVLVAASVGVWRERAIPLDHVMDTPRSRVDANQARTSRPSGTSSAHGDAHDAPLGSATSAAAAARNSDRVQTAAVAGRPRHVPETARTGLIEPAGFVAVPGAASLPQFESGTIVRLELPVSVLPEYGVDIFPAEGQPVEADVLVGQDGQARAIRLVTQTVRSSQ